MAGSDLAAMTAAAVVPSECSVCWCDVMAGVTNEEWGCCPCDVIAGPTNEERKGGSWGAAVEASCCCK